jgi:hypothetical protein
MKMPEIREVLVYKYDELDEKAKEKALEKFAYVDVEFGDYAECVREEFAENMSKAGVEYVNLYWSTDRDRHAYMHKPSVDSKKILSVVIGCSQTDAKEFDDFSVTLSTSHYGGGCARNFVDVEYDGEDKEAELRATGYTEKVQEWLDDMFNDFLRAVSTAFDDATSREHVEEFIRANEYEFRENGEVFR